MRDDTSQPDVPATTDAQTADLGSSEPAAPILLQDRWWWSPTLSLVLGGVITAMQVSALRTGGVWLNWLPITATAPADAGVLTQIYYLLLPSFPLVFVLFGYIARMARARTVEALDADYTRTAVLKGLPRRTVLWRHVLRNALLPTITVIATQMGYLIGGLVVVEVLFHYDGIGSLIYIAARGKDFPMLEAGILCIGIVYTFATLSADLLYSALNPRIRFGAAE